jgi:hypothetical protein
MQLRQGRFPLRSWSGDRSSGSAVNEHSRKARPCNSLLNSASTTRSATGRLGLPADFLLDSRGRVVAVKYGLRATTNGQSTSCSNLPPLPEVAPQLAGPERRCTRWGLINVAKGGLENRRR